MEIIATLHAEHASGNSEVGIELEGACKDVGAKSIWYLHFTKFFALKYVADVVCTVLRVDQVAQKKAAAGCSCEKGW